MWGKIVSSVSNALDFNQATLSGCIDIICVRSTLDNKLRSTPFHVRFGKAKLLRSREKVVTVTVNGQPTDLLMKLGAAGEAYFVQEEDLSSEAGGGDEGDDNETGSPGVLSPRSNTSGGGGSHEGLGGGLLNPQQSSSNSNHSAHAQNSSPSPSMTTTVDSAPPVNGEQVSKPSLGPSRSSGDRKDLQQQNSHSKEEEEEIRGETGRGGEGGAVETYHTTSSLEPSSSSSSANGGGEKEEDKQFIHEVAHGTPQSDSTAPPPPHASLPEPNHHQHNGGVHTPAPTGGVSSSSRGSHSGQSEEEKKSGEGETSPLAQGKSRFAHLPPEAQQIGAGPVQDSTVEADIAAGAASGVSFSLCGHMLTGRITEEQHDNDVFNANVVSWESFDQNPALWFHPSLVARFDDKPPYYPGKVALPLLACWLVFNRPLSLPAVSRLMSAEVTAKFPDPSSSSWFFGGGGFSPFSHQPHKGEGRGPSSGSSSLPPSSSSSSSSHPFLGKQPTLVFSSKNSIAQATASAAASVAAVEEEAGIVGGGREREEEGEWREGGALVSSGSFHSEDGGGASGGSGLLPSASASTSCTACATRRLRRSLRPTPDQLEALNLKPGANSICFTVSSSLQGTKSVSATIYLWPQYPKIVISDVDGTITRSDVLGQLMPIVGRDWSHDGVAELFTKIKKAGYLILYLTARAIGQADATRDYLFGLTQQQTNKLPDGPLILSPDRLFPSFKREVIERKPYIFKIAALRDIRSLFPPDYNPFYAGFGNRDSDHRAYVHVGVAEAKVFIIDPSGVIHHINNSTYARTYESMSEIADFMFPPLPRADGRLPDEALAREEEAEEEQFNSFNFWSLGIVEFPSEEEEEEDEEEEELHLRVAREHEEAMEFVGRGGQAILPPLLIPSSSPPPPVRRVPSAASSAETAAIAAANAAAAAAVAIEVATWDARTASSFLGDSRNSSSGSTPPHLASLPAALAHPTVTASPSISGEVSSSGDLIDESQIEEEEEEEEQRWMENGSPLPLTNKGVSSVYNKPVSSLHSDERRGVSSSSIGRRQVFSPRLSDVDSSRYDMNMAGMNGGIDNNRKTPTVTEEEVESVEAAALTAAFTAALDEQENKAKTARPRLNEEEEKRKKRQVNNPDLSEPADDEPSQATHTHEQDVSATRPASGLSGGREKEAKASIPEERRGDRDEGSWTAGGLPSREDVSNTLPREMGSQDGREGNKSPALLHHIDNCPLSLRSVVSPIDEGEEEKKPSEKVRTTSEEQEKVIQPRRRWFFRDSFRRFGEPSSTSTDTTSPTTTQLKLSHSQPSGRRLSETSEVVEGLDDHRVRSRQGHRSFPDTRDLLAYQEKNDHVDKEKEKNSRLRSYSSVERSGRGSSKGHLLQNSLEALSDDDGSNSRKTSPQSKARQALCGGDPAAEDDAAEFDGAGVCSAFWRKKAHGEPSPEKEHLISGDSELNDHEYITRNCPVDVGSASSLPISSEVSSRHSNSQPLIPAPLATTVEREDAAVGNVCTAVTASARDGMKSTSSLATEGSHGPNKTPEDNPAVTPENEGEGRSSSSQPVSRRRDGCRAIEGEKKASELSSVEKGLEKTSRRHLLSRLLWRREVWTPNPSQLSPPPQPEIRPSSSFFSWSPVVVAPSSSSSSTAATVDGTAEESSGCQSAPPDSRLTSCPAVRSASCSVLKDCEVPSAPSSPPHAAEGQEVYPGRHRKVSSCGSLAKRVDCTKELHSDSAGGLHEEPFKCDSQNPSCETGANSPSYFLCEEADPGQAPAGSVAVETADPVSRGLSQSSRPESTPLPRRTDRFPDQCECDAPRSDGNDANQGNVAEDERTARCSPLTSSRSSSVDPAHLRTQESFRSLDEGAGGDKHHTETET